MNKYLVEMANIREHCSWVHMQEKEKATKKAFELIKMAVARGRQLEQIEDQQLPMVQSALVVGGGIAGMAAALNIASQGFKVDLLEATDKLGGNALRLFHTITSPFEFAEGVDIYWARAQVNDASRRSPISSHRMRAAAWRR